MEQLDAVPMVQVLEIPVPQMVEQLLEVFRRLDIEVSAQVIEVPKISQDCIRERLVDCDLRHPQMAEQLMEVPAVLSLALLQYTEQIVDNPAPRGRGRRGGVQGFFPGQSSTAAADVDIPILHGDLQGFLPGQGSSASSSHSPGAADEAGLGGFRAFRRDKKSTTLPPRWGSELPPHSSPWTSAAYALPTVLEKEKQRRRVQEEAAEAMDQARLLLERAAKRRKRKKKRKKKVPRTSSHSSSGCARRRLRQWHARFAGFAGDVTMRAVFPSVVARPEMLGIKAGMDQKDSPRFW